MPDAPTISVSFPAAPEFLRLVRLATADVASRAGFDYEEIDDLRIGTSELCSMISGAADAVVRLDFAYDDVSVSVRGTADPGALVVNELSEAIVRAVVDEYEIVHENGVATFHASKRTRNR